MEINTKKIPKGAGRAPSLETLINTIDRQFDQIPSLSTAEGIAAFLGRRVEDYQRKTEQYVRFFLGNTEFALPLKNTLEIDYAPEVIPIPNLPQWVQGICNLRGDIVSVVDIKLILRLKPWECDKGNKLILIRNKNISTAFIVDNISGILIADIHEKGKPLTDMDFSKYVKKTLIAGRQAVHLLDLDVLMAAIKL